MKPSQAGRGRLLLQLFWSTFCISACTFGGGFVIVSFMKKKFVDELHWMDEQEMLDYTALAQTSPGAIAVNAAMLVGWRMAGFIGMLTAMVGTVLPPMIILSLVSLCYAAFAANAYVGAALRGMQAGVAAVIIDVALQLGSKVAVTRSPLHIGIMLAAFVAVWFFKVNVMWILLAAALIGVGTLLWARRRGGTAA